MLEGWYSGFRNPQPSKSVSVRGLSISVEGGAVYANNPKANAFSPLRGKDFGIDWELSEGAVLLHAPSKDEDFIYLLDPGSRKIVRLDLYFEGDYFGFYSKDYPLPFRLSDDFCASACRENLLIVDSKRKKYSFTNKNGERFSAPMKMKRCLGCAAFEGEGGIACDEGKVFLFLKGERAEINLNEVTDEKMGEPVFGAGKSKNYSWAAVKGRGWNFSILIATSGEERFSYTRFPLNELKGRELL